MADPNATPWSQLKDTVSDFFGAIWTEGAAKESSYSQFMAIDAANRGGLSTGALPGFGPSVPSGYSGLVTQNIPGAIFDSGFTYATTYDGQSSGLRWGAFPGAAARATTDLNVSPYRAIAADERPLTQRLAAWWDGATGTITKPAQKIDAAAGAESPPLTPGLLLIAAGVVVVGAVAIIKGK